MRAVWSIVLAGVVGVAGAGDGARGDGAGGAPAGETLPGSRTVKTFDFEEAKVNFNPTPMYWSKVVGPGFPPYSEGQFDRTRYRSKNTSFELKTVGGSVAYRFDPPADKRIPVHANADYYVIAFVRTSQLKHARADITAWYADEDGMRLMPTEAHSQAYAAGAGAAGGVDAWQVLYVYVPGPVADADGTVKAKSLVLQLGLMQPQQLGSESTLGKFALYQQDVQGAVWFDDMTVFQLPRVGITPRQQANGLTPPRMFGHDEPVTLDVALSDLTQSAEGVAARGPFKARVRVTNPQGLVFGEQVWNLASSASQGWTQQFTHAPLPAGMYTATLDVLDEGAGKNGGLMARRQTQFLCLPDSARPGFCAPEFGLGASSFTDTATWGQLPLLLRQTGAGTLQVPVWRWDMPEDSLTRRDVPLENLLATMQRQNVRMIGAFSEMPRVLAKRITPGSSEDRGSIQGLLSAETALWRPYMSFLLTRYANRLEWWELGSQDEPFSGTMGAAAGGTPEATAAQRSMALYKKTYGEIGSMLTRQELIIPWNALFEFEAARYPKAALDLRLPTVIKPSQLPAYIESFRDAESGAGDTGGGKRAPIFAHLDGLDLHNASRDDRLADFAQRVVYAYTSSPESILLDVDESKPDELLLVYETMIRALGGTHFEGELPVVTESGAMVKAFLFRKAAGGATLVLWTDTAGREVALDLPLGKAPKTSDLLGNPLALQTDKATQLTRVKASTTPLVLENVEPQVLELTCSFAISTPVLPAGAGAVRTEVLLKNPFTETLSGSLRILLPKGWTVDPPTLPVALAAGASMRQEVTLRYPFTENAGVKQLNGRLTLDPGNPTGMATLQVTYPLMVSSQAVEMEGFTQMDANGDILVQQVITNTSGAALDAQSYALLPGFPQQHRYVVGLQPNQTTIKRYTFSPKDYAGEKGAGGLAKALAGAAATMGVRQNDGRTLLTKSIPIE